MIILPAPPLKNISPETVTVQCLNGISPIEGTSSFHLSAKNNFACVKRKLSYFLREQDGSEKDLKDRVNQSDMTGLLECEKLVNRYLLFKYCRNILQHLYTISSTRKMAIVVQFVHNANTLLKVLKRMKSRARIMIGIIVDNHVGELKFLRHSWAFFYKKACHVRLRLSFGLEAMRDANSYVIFKEGSRLFRLLRVKVEKRRREKGPAEMYCRIRQSRKAMAVLKLVVTSKDNALEFDYKKNKEETMSIMRRAKQIVSLWRKICTLKFSQHSVMAISMTHVVQKSRNACVATIAVLKRIRVKSELWILGNSVFTRKVGLLKGWKVLVAAMVRRKTRGLKKSMTALVRRTTLLKTAFKGLMLNYTEGNILLQKGSLHSTVCLKGCVITILSHNIDRFRSRREKDALIEVKIAEGKLRRSFQRVKRQLILGSKRSTEKGRHQRKVSVKMLTEASFVKKQIYFKRLLRHHLVQVRIKRGRMAILQQFCNLPFQQWVHYARLRSPPLSASPKSQILKEGKKGKKRIV
jgi:hypothetical protein